MAGVRFSKGVVLVLLLGAGVWGLLDLKRPTLEECLWVGEPPSGLLVMETTSTPDLTAARSQAQAALPGQVVSLKAEELTMTKQKNWNGKKSLLIQVDGNTVDIQKTPELYKAGLLSLASQIFSKSSTYGIVRLRVFRNGLWVYGASMIRGRTTKHEFYVQQDWRCKDPIFAIPKY